VRVGAQQRVAGAHHLRWPPASAAGQPRSCCRPHSQRTGGRGAGGQHSELAHSVAPGARQGQPALQRQGQPAPLLRLQRASPAPPPTCMTRASCLRSSLPLTTSLVLVGSAASSPPTATIVTPPAPAPKPPPASSSPAQDGSGTREPCSAARAGDTSASLQQHLPGVGASPRRVGKGLGEHVRCGGCGGLRGQLVAEQPCGTREAAASTAPARPPALRQLACRWGA
jgi:hypothetical protein